MTDQQVRTDQPDQQPAPADPAQGTPGPGTSVGDLSPVPEPKPTPARRRRQRAANAEADKQGDDMDDRLGDKEPQRGDDSSLPDEREEWFRAPGLRRMKMEFSKGDLDIMRRVNLQIEDAVYNRFREAFAITSRIWDVVREPEVDEPTGEIKIDNNGYPIWKRDPITGSYLEDWSQLTLQQRENFLFEITTNLFVWEQRAAEMWTTAMFSKAIFTERFAIEYDAPMSGTIEDRTAVGNEKAAEDRYFALMQTAVSRRADAVVRTMTNLMLRLRDSMPS